MLALAGSLCRSRVWGSRVGIYRCPRNRSRRRGTYSNSRAGCRSMSLRLNRDYLLRASKAKTNRFASRLDDPQRVVALHPQIHPEKWFSHQQSWRKSSPWCKAEMGMADWNPGESSFCVSFCSWTTLNSRSERKPGQSLRGSPNSMKQGAVVGLIRSLATSKASLR